jgi:hypothetical protein
LENYATDLKAPKVTLRPTMPYTHEEMKLILSGVDDYAGEMPSRGKENAERMRTLILLLRFSGLRISDAIHRSTDQLTGNGLFLYTQKTGVPVNLILPDVVCSALRPTPRSIGFGPVRVSLKPRLQTGEHDYKGYLNSPRLRMGMPIVSAIRLRLSCSLLVFPSKEYLFCSAINRFE